MIFIQVCIQFVCPKYLQLQCRNELWVVIRKCYNLAFAGPALQPLRKMIWSYVLIPQSHRQRWTQDNSDQFHINALYGITKVKIT